MPSSMPIKDADGQLCIPNIINGSPEVLPTTSNFPVFSARKQTTLHYGQTATVELTRKAADAAAEAFKTYRKIPVHERYSMLLRAADLLEQRAEEGVKRQMQETSCSEDWAKFNAMAATGTVRGIAAALHSAVKGEMQPSVMGNTSLVFKEPVGPVLIIPP